jgi:AraC family transcriptional regulator
MSHVHPLTLDPARNDKVEIFPRLPMLSSHQADWNGLYLEYHRQPAHETPEFHLEQHLISIYVGHPGTNLMMNGNWQRESYKPGDIVILPAHQPLKTGWDQEVEFI